MRLAVGLTLLALLGLSGCSSATETTTSGQEQHEAAPRAATPPAEEPQPEESEPSSSSGEKDEVGNSSHATDEKFCGEHQCIGSFTTEEGTIVECSDGSYSHAGGISGSCSDHGGNANKE